MTCLDMHGELNQLGFIGFHICVRVISFIHQVTFESQLVNEKNIGSL